MCGMRRSMLALVLVALLSGLLYWLSRTREGARAGQEPQPAAATDAGSSNEPAPASAAIATQDRQTVEGPTSEPQQITRSEYGAPIPAELQWLAPYLRKAGVPIDDATRLVDAAAWQELESLWVSESAHVTEKRQAHHELGKRLAREKLEAGDITRFPGLTRPIGPGDPDYEAVKARTQKRHEDEWITTKAHFVDGTPCFDVVRILPGEQPELDLALRALRDQEARRAVALREFFAARKPPDTRDR